MGPGSAAHRHSASKTRVNALMALRCARDTKNKSPGRCRGFRVGVASTQYLVMSGAAAGALPVANFQLARTVT
jgi:hypothetical protein